MSAEWLKRVGSDLSDLGCVCEGEVDLAEPTEHTCWSCKAGYLLSIVVEQAELLVELTEENTQLRSRLAGIARLLPGGEA